MIGDAAHADVRAFLHRCALPTERRVRRRMSVLRRTRTKQVVSAWTEQIIAVVVIAAVILLVVKRIYVGRG